MFKLILSAIVVLTVANAMASDDGRGIMDMVIKLSENNGAPTAVESKTFLNTEAGIRADLQGESDQNSELENLIVKSMSMDSIKFQF